MNPMPYLGKKWRKKKRRKKINNLEEILMFAKKIGIQAGDKLLSFQSELSKLKVSDKKSFGVASNADKEIEKELITAIEKNFPSHHILAEESAYEKYTNEQLLDFSKKESCWIIDPLDGTNNFLCSSDYFAVSIAFISFGIPQVGLIYRPATSECFSAVKGCGVKLSNKNKDISLKKHSNDKPLNDGMLITSSVFTLNPNINEEFDLLKDMTLKSRGVRRLGSAALDLCYLALGQWDGFWAKGLSPWDTAAAVLICQETQVRVTDYQGRDYSPFSSSIIAARNPFFGRFFKVLKR